MRFTTLRLMQLLQYTGKIGLRVQLHQLLYILQQKGFDYGLFFKRYKEGMAAPELGTEMEFLVNIGYAKIIFSDGANCYCLNTAYSETTPIDELPDREQAIVDALEDLEPAILLETAILFFLNEKKNKKNEKLQQELAALKPDLFNHVFTAYDLYNQIRAI